MQIGEWKLNLNSNELVGRGGLIKLESKCAQTLAYLAVNAGQVVSHDDLLDNVWGRQSISLQSVPVVISKLRAVLGDDRHNPCYIETIPKRGYRLIAETKTGMPATPAARPQSRTAVFAVLTVVLFFAVAGFSVSGFGISGTAKPVPPRHIDYSSHVSGVETLHARAQHLWSLRGRENNVLALELVRQALELDPLHAPSNALIAQIYTRYDATYLGMGAQDTLSLARQHIATARGGDPNHPAVLLAEAGAYITIDWRPDRALEVLERAVVLEPENGHLWRLHSVALYMLGQLDQAFTSQEQALKGEMNSPHFRIDQVRLYYAKGECDRVLDIAANNKAYDLGGSNFYLAACLNALGQHAQALSVFQRYMNAAGYMIAEHPTFDAPAHGPQYAYAQLLNQYRDTFEQRQHHVLVVALMLFAGQEDEALEYLEHIPSSRSTNFMNAIHLWPMFDGFKDNPRFQRVLRRIGVASMANCIHSMCKARDGMSGA